MDKVCALIVTYFPGSALVSMVRSLNAEFDFICIVDNNSSCEWQAQLKELDSSVFIVELKDNLGIAAALNRGVEYALKFGCNWVCCFDQDSHYIQGSRSRYHKALENKCHSRVVGTSYNKPSFASIFERFKAKETEGYNHTKTVISSGCFFSIQLWRAVGGFDETLFIDSVDHDFCLKVQRAGGDVVLLSDRTIEHSVGVDESAMGVPLHEPIRKYYIFRNVILLIRRYFRYFPLWSVSQVFRLIVEIVSLLVFEPNKLAKVKMALTGIGHGLQGKSGKYVFE